jgi:hypothetical protein
MNLSKYINLKKRNNVITDKDLFIDLMDAIKHVWERTSFMSEEIKIDTTDYDEDFYIIIENLIILHYGEVKGEIILWWLFERLDENNEVLPINIEIKTDEGDIESKEVLVKTSSELWDFLNKYIKINE